MSKKEKLLKKVQGAPNKVREKLLLSLMTAFGFYTRTKKTKHGLFFKHDKLKGRHLPHVAIPTSGNKDIKKPYIDECLDAIELLTSIEEEEEK